MNLPTIPAMLCLGTVLACGAVQASTEQPAAPVGTVTFALGQVQIRHADGNVQPLRKGQMLQAADTVETGDNGQVHVRMVDQALVSVRPNSRLRIQEYRFDAAQPERSVIRFALENGTVRSITGAGGQAARDHYRLNTPLAAIGVRGTDFTVAANADAVRVGVHSGAIALSPYGADCAADGAAACSGASTSVLTAGMRDLHLELQRGAARPELVPASPDLDALSNEPAARSKATTLAAAAANSPSEAVAETNAGKALTPATQITPPPVKPPVTPPVAPPVIIPPPDKVAFAWGRYATLAQQGEALGKKYEVVGGNDLFGLVRDNYDIALPQGGSFGFAYGGGEAYLATASGRAAAGITDPRLTVDFGNKTFDTRLTVTSGNVSRQVSGSGTFDISGLLNAKSTTPDTRINGALNSDGTQAGYVFTRDLGADGRLQGATVWHR